MPRKSLRCTGRVAAFALGLILLCLGVAAAQQSDPNQPGQFDFYVLALSWSPSYCAEVKERGTPPTAAVMRRPSVRRRGARAVAAI